MDRLIRMLFLEFTRRGVCWVIEEVIRYFDD